jgi:hypothetical protein
VGARWQRYAYPVDSPYPNNALPRVPAPPTVRSTFPKYELLGWYAVSDDVNAAHSTLHRALCQLNESPLFLQLSPSHIRADSRAMPLHLRLGQPDSAQGVIWTDSTVVLEATETERTCIDFISSQQALAGGRGASHAAPSAEADEAAREALRAVKASPALTALESSAGALRVLQERLATAAGFVDDCASGKVVMGPSPRALLRAVSATIARLPLPAPHALPAALAHEKTDALVLALAASVADGAAGLTVLTNRLAECSTLHASSDKRDHFHPLRSAAMRDARRGGMLNIGESDVR